MISNQSGNAGIYPRLLIHKEDGPSALIEYCEFADGANNNAGVALIPRGPTMQDAVQAMQTPLNMGIGGSLDCGSEQPFTEVVREIWLPEASNGSSTAFYDVSATFAFGSPSPQTHQDRSQASAVPQGAAFRHPWAGPVRSTRD